MKTNNNVKENILIRVGDVYGSGNSQVRVMAISEGYVMFRRKGCVPLVKSMNDFVKFIKGL